LNRYWLTPAYEEGFDEKVVEINAVYQQAPERAKQGLHTESLVSESLVRYVAVQSFFEEKIPVRTSFSTTKARSAVNE